MKIAIIGSRTFNNYDLLCDVLLQYNNQISLIVSGGARGADTLAEQYANEHNINTKIFLAEWNKYGKAAGYRRNVDIINEADIVVAFWDGKSKGTLHSINLAKKLNKELIIKIF